MRGGGADDLVGKPVVSGTGEPLGLVVEVERYPSGAPRRIVFREYGGPLRRVKLEHVRLVAADGITLKGPREGFHMTRLAPGSFTPEGPRLPPPGGTPPGPGGSGS